MDKLGDKVDKRQIIGKRGEQLVADYLNKQGFIILERNYWKKFGEIDLIAKKGNNLHFVEVKTVSRETLPPEEENIDDYSPEENIHPWKMKRLARTIEIYLQEKDVPENIDWQLDGALVYLDPVGKLLKIEMIEDIF